MTGCEYLIPELQDALADSLVISEDEGDCKIRFPFVRPDGDSIRVWVIEQGDEYLVTDEGETYGMLYLSGIDVEADARSDRISATKRRFGLDSATFEISKTTDETNLGHTILEVYEAIQHIAALEHTRRPYPQDDFRADVADYLNQNQFEFRSNVEVEGYAEPQTVDFSITEAPQPTFMQAIRASDTSDLHSKSEDTSYRFYQIKRVKEGCKFLSVVDDDHGVYSEEKMKPLFADSDQVIRWTERNHIATAIRA